MNIKPNDIVILYFNQKQLKKIKVQPNHTTNTHMGEIKHNTLLDKPYGTTLQLNHKYIHILQPQPSLHLKTINFRTQILYEQDISIILFLLNIQEDTRIIECGTGSGVLTYYLSKHILSGAIYTYEQNKERFEIFVKEIEDNQICNVIPINKNIKEGFDQEGVDAIILDMPDPWGVVKHAYQALRQEGRICIFVPSIEQIQKVVEASKGYFYDIRMYENIKKEYMRVKEGYMGIPDQYSHTGYLLFAKKGIHSEY